MKRCPVIVLVVFCHQSILSLIFQSVLRHMALCYIVHPNTSDFILLAFFLQKRALITVPAPDDIRLTSYVRGKAVYWRQWGSS